VEQGPFVLFGTLDMSDTALTPLTIFSSAARPESIQREPMTNFHGVRARHARLHHEFESGREAKI
jgi:hypothetical protein